MNLTPEQIAEMDNLLNFQQMDENLFSEMDAVLNESDSINKGNAGGLGRALAYGLSGGNIPFGNVITSGIGAGIAKAASPITGDPRSFAELYEQAQADTFATQKANPGATLAGNVLGIASTLPLASSKAIFGATPVSGVRGSLNVIPQTISKVDRFVRSGKAAKDASTLTKAGSLALRSGKGAVVAAPISGLYAAGETEGDRGEAFLSGSGLGAAIGASLPVAGAALSTMGAALPKVDVALAQVGKLAQKHNIPVSFDQLTSSRPIKNVQKVSQELPFSGQEAFRDKQMASFNKAIFKTIGMDADKFTPEVMDKAFSKLGKEFEILGAGKKFQFGDDFVRILDAIRSEAQDIYTKDSIQNFESVVGKALKEADGQGYISGEKLNKIRSNVNSLARKTKNQETKELLHDFENVLIDTMTGGNEAEKKAFNLTKQKYKNLLAIEPLAAKAKGGNISPSALSSRVSRIYGRQYVRGKAGEIGEIAEVGRQLLPELGGSDTTQKMLYAGGALGAGVLDAGLTASTLAGNRLMQSGIFRNQPLMNIAIKNADQAIDIIEQGGQVTARELASLPKKEQTKLLNRIMQMAPSRAALIKEEAK